MKKAVGLCCAGAVLWLSGGQAVHAQGKHALRALLVDATYSQDKKQITQLGDIDDDQADLTLMTQMLTLPKILGERESKIATLKVSAATHDRILEALNKLAEETQPGDAVVFYFTGHGVKGKAQLSLCPWDVMADSGGRDITESDIDKWLRKVNQKTRNVTLILDSCYSTIASNSRPVAPRYRVKAITRKETGPTTPGQQFHISPDRAVILSAANENGTALQVTAADKTWAGLFTWKMVREMSRVTDTTTYRELLHNTRADVQKWAEKHQDDALGGNKMMQSPTLAGSDALVDRALFSDVPDKVVPAPQGAAPPAAHPVGTVESATQDTVKVNAGRDSDLPPGSKLQASDADGKIVDLTVQKVEGDIVEAVPDNGVSAKAISPNTQVVPTHAQIDVAAGSKIMVRLDGSPPFQAKMREALASFKFVSVATAPKAKAQMVIRGTTNKDGIKVSLMEPDGVSYVDPDNPTLTAKSADELAGKIGKELGQLAVVSAMLKLQNPARPFMVGVEASQPQYRVGESAVFTCKADRECYIFLYTVDSAGYPTLLYPMKAEESNLLKKGDTLQLPPTNSQLTFAVSPPFGFVKVTVLAVLDPQVAENLKKQLLTPPQDAESHVGSRSIRAVEDLQKLQLGALDNWTVSSYSVSVLQPEKPQGVPGRF